MLNSPTIEKLKCKRQNKRVPDGGVIGYQS